uniref:Uncharacterized protein n=1 Tax=Parascaris equorum TaxID=6256 RepID=A0A914RJW7_PAREQ
MQLPVHKNRPSNQDRTHTCRIDCTCHAHYNLAPHTNALTDHNRLLYNLHDKCIDHQKKDHFHCIILDMNFLRNMDHYILRSNDIFRLCIRHVQNTQICNHRSFHRHHRLLRQQQPQIIEFAVSEVHH